MSVNEPQPKTQLPRKKASPHRPKVTLIFDTNFLYTESKHLLVCKNFEKLMEEFGPEFELTIALPEVVFRELSSQTINTARNSLKGLLGLASDFEKISGIDPKISVTPSQVEKSVLKRYENWAKLHNIKLEPVPHQLLDIREMLNLAISCESVFETKRLANNGTEVFVAEKGFKDFVILKSIENFVTGILDQVLIGILCSDKKLSAELHKIKHSESVKVIQDWESVFSQLQGIIEHLDNDWIEALLPKANKEFFNIEGRSGLWFSTVRPRIEKMFSDELERFPAPNFLEPIGYWGEWTPERGNFLVDNPTFIGIDQGRYLWSTQVHYQRVFNRIPAVGSNSIYEVLRHGQSALNRSRGTVSPWVGMDGASQASIDLYWNVSWSTAVSDTGDLTDSKLEKVVVDSSRDKGLRGLLSGSV